MQEEHRSGSVPYLGWVLLATIVYGIIHGYNFWLTLSGNSDSSPFGLSNILSISMSLISNAAIWLAIGLAFRAIPAAMIALVLSIVPSLAQTFLEIETTWLYLFFNFSAALLFGVLHFRDYRSLFLLLLPLTVIGLSSALWSGAYTKYLNAYMYLLNVDFIPLTFKVSTGGNTYRTQEWLFSVTSAALIPVKYLLLHHILRWLGNTKKSFLSFTTLDLKRTGSTWQYAAIYWIFHTTLLVTALGIYFYVYNYSMQQQFDSNAPNNLGFALYLILYAVAMYVVASIYRNEVTGYFINHCKPLRWIYFLMHIPVIGGIFWLISLFSLSAKRSYSHKEISEYLHREVASGKYAIIAVFCLIVFAGTLLKLFGGSHVSNEVKFIYMYSAVGSLAFILLYKAFPRVVFILPFLAAGVLLTLGFNEELRRVEWPSLIGAINFIILYPVFHLTSFDAPDPRDEQVGVPT